MVNSHRLTDETAVLPGNCRDPGADAPSGVKPRIGALAWASAAVARSLGSAPLDPARSPTPCSCGRSTISRWPWTVVGSADRDAATGMVVHSPVMGKLGPIH